MNEHGTSPARPRLARLRPEFSPLYPGIIPDVWLQVSVMVDQVWAIRLRRGEAGAPLRERILNPEHFEFRYGTSRGGGNPAPRGQSSDRGELWRSMRVKRLPADTVARLRKLTEAELASRLGVLAEWKLESGHYVAISPGANLAPRHGVRRKESVVQLGLSSSEIGAVWSRAQQLLRMIDDGDIATY